MLIQIRLKNVDAWIIEKSGLTFKVEACPKALDTTRYYFYKYVMYQGLLELLWTVYSEGKLQSSLKLRKFSKPF